MFQSFQVVLDVGLTVPQHVFQGLVRKATLTSWGIFDTPLGETVDYFRHASPDFGGASPIVL